MKKKAASLLLALVLCVSCLSACGGNVSGSDICQIWHPDSPAETVPAQTPEQDPEPEAVAEQEPESEATAEQDPEADVTLDEPSADSASVTLDPASVQGVARIARLVGNYSHPAIYEDRGKYVVVRTDDPHNPYDLTWRYGPEPDPIQVFSNGKTREKPDSMLVKEMADPEWDSLYREYVGACDWSLVFDADYYKKAFPMLAKLYHEDDALLLEHFQTQGVHEGRQASADFNAAAYMSNCGQDIVDAFGDACECYYFYWMLNQDTERSVRTINEKNLYPRWLTLELSVQQEYELEKVTEYREEAEAVPAAMDPELVAFSNYRAWNDAVYNIYAHDWLHSDDTQDDVNDCLDRVSLNRISENTVKWYHTSFCGVFERFAMNYRYSQSHYEAMVSDDNCFAGFSNPYFSDNPSNTGDSGREKTGCCCQFDLYASEPASTPYKLN